MIGRLGRQRAGRFSQAALYSNDSKTRYMMMATHAAPARARAPVPGLAQKVSLLMGASIYYVRKKIDFNRGWDVISRRSILQALPQVVWVWGKNFVFSASSTIRKTQISTMIYAPWEKPFRSRLVQFISCFCTSISRCNSRFVLKLILLINLPVGPSACRESFRVFTYLSNRKR